MNRKNRNTLGGSLTPPSSQSAYTKLPYYKSSDTKSQAESQNDCSPAGLWHLNETQSALIGDASGKPNYGTSMATGTFEGRFVQARRFTVPNGKIEIPHNASMNRGNRDLSLLFRGGLGGSKGNSFTIHQELSSSRIDFAESTCPVPGTGSPYRRALNSNEIGGPFNLRHNGHCKRTSFRVWTNSPACSL